MSADFERERLAAVHPTLRRGLTPALRMLSRRRLGIGMVRCIRALEFGVTWVLGRGVPSRMIAGKAGDPDVRIFIIDKRVPATTPTPALLHIHGGGYVTGRPALMFKLLARVSSELNCLVISVDYRRAPETIFPGALDDNYSALRWLHANAENLSIDRSRIAVMGESAGGGHAAALAIAARDRAEFALAYQVLIYPMLDDRSGSSRPLSSPDAGAFMWTASSNVYGWTSLLGMPAGSASPPYGSVPARVADLAGLPDAWIGSGTLDLFFDEDMDYARRLAAAGVNVTVQSTEGGYHAFDMLVPDAPASIAFTQGWMVALKDALAR